MDLPRRDQIEVVADELGQRFAELRVLPQRDDEMAASLRRYGQLSPVTVFRSDGDQLEVIDGFRRVRAAEQQGYPEQLAVRVLDVDEVQALAAVFTLHRGRTGLTELEEGWLVRALVREHHLEQRQVAQLLRRHPSWVSRRLLLIESLGAEVQQDVRLGICSATTAREIARLPRGMQADCARLIASRGLTTRQVAQLVAAALQRGVKTAAELEALCDQRGEARSSRGEARSSGAHLTDDIALLERLLPRLQRRLVEHPLAELPPAEATAFRARLRAALALLTALTECVTHALEEDKST